MKRPNALSLRIISACALGLFLVESLVVDMNGRLFDLSAFWSRSIFVGTIAVGVVISSVLLWLDTGWRVLHFGCLVVYVAMVLPVFMG